ncbi:MAG: glycosyltransferase family 4 protein [Fibrobacterota bacterium]
MNTAYVHTGLWPSNSPSITFSTMTAAALADLGECRFYIKKNSREKDSSVFRNVFGFDLPEGLRIKDPGRGGLFFTNKLFFRRTASEIINAAQSGEVDAVISRNPGFLPSLYRIKKETGIPVFYETHDFFGEPKKRYEGRVPAKSLKWKDNEKKYFPLISGIICLHETQKRKISEHYPDISFFTARTGLVIKPEKRPPPVRKKKLIYTGSFDAHKGVALFLRAAALSESAPDIVLAGGKTPDEVRAANVLAAELYDSRKVTVTGWLDKTSLRNIMDECSAGVLPLEDTYFNRYLTSPLKLFDYYEALLPVIASDLDSLRELTFGGKTGILFSPGKEEGLAAAFDSFFSAENTAKRAVSFIRNIQEDLSWRTRAQKIRDIIKENTD